MLLVGVTACGDDAVCPTGTEGSPCLQTTEPGTRPEIPSASTPDTVTPDVDARDGVDGDGDGSDSGDTGAVDAPAPDDNPDANAARRPWARVLASFAAPRSNEAPGREPRNTNDTGILDAAVVHGRGIILARAPTLRCDAGARNHDTEMSDDDDPVAVGDAEGIRPRPRSRWQLFGARYDSVPV